MTLLVVVGIAVVVVDNGTGDVIVVGSVGVYGVVAIVCVGIGTVVVAVPVNSTVVDSVAVCYC